MSFDFQASEIKWLLKENMRIRQRGSHTSAPCTFQSSLHQLCSQHWQPGSPARSHRCGISSLAPARGFLHPCGKQDQEKRALKLPSPKAPPLPAVWVYPTSKGWLNMPLQLLGPTRSYKTRQRQFVLKLVTNWYPDLSYSLLALSEKPTEEANLLISVKPSCHKYEIPRSDKTKSLQISLYWKSLSCSHGNTFLSKQLGLRYLCIFAPHF